MKQTVFSVAAGVIQLSRTHNLIVVPWNARNIIAVTLECRFDRASHRCSVTFRRRIKVDAVPARRIYIILVWGSGPVYPKGNFSSNERNIYVQAMFMHVYIYVYIYNKRHFVLHNVLRRSCDKDCASVVWSLQWSIDWSCAHNYWPLQTPHWTLRGILLCFTQSEDKCACEHLLPHWQGRARDI